MRFEIVLVFVDRSNMVYEIANLKPWNWYIPKKPAKYIVEFDKREYDDCLKIGVAEEDARYLKPQGTAFKAVVKMNSHALLDWFKIRCCLQAQNEIRDLAWKMLVLCKKAAPDVFAKAGPSCVAYGFCTENSRQHPDCKAKGKLTMEQAKAILNEHKNEWNN
jgi:thymidylate synthase (FAD)